MDIRRLIHGVVVAAMICDPLAAQQVNADALFRLAPAERELALEGFRRAGIPTADQISGALRSSDPETARSIVRELALQAPLGEDVELRIKSYADVCPLEVFPDISLLLLISQSLKSSRDIDALRIGRHGIGSAPDHVRARLDHYQSVALEIASIAFIAKDWSIASKHTSEDTLQKALRAFNTPEASDFAARLVVRYDMNSAALRAALEDALDRHASPRVQGTESIRCTWTSKAILKTQPESACAIKALAFLASNGSTLERLEAHQQLRTSSLGLEPAIPYIKACLADSDALDVRVVDWLSTLTLRPEYSKHCTEELRVIMIHGSDKGRRLARFLVDIQRS